MGQYKEDLKEGKVEEIQLTKDQADVLKRLEIRKSISDLESLKPTEQGVEPGWFKKLPGAIRSALISLHYQVGPDKFRGFVQMRRALELSTLQNARDPLLTQLYKEAADNILYNYRDSQGNYDYQNARPEPTLLHQQMKGDFNSDRAEAIARMIREQKLYDYEGGVGIRLMKDQFVDPENQIKYKGEHADGFIAKKPSLIMTGEYSGAGENPEVTIQMNALENRILATTGHLMKLRQEENERDSNLFMSSVENRIRKTMENAKLSEDRVNKKEAAEKQMLQVQMPVMNSVVDNKTINNTTNPILMPQSSRNEFNRFRTA